MTEVKEYKSGKVLDVIEKTLEILASFESPFGGTEIGNKILEEVSKADPRRVSTERASELVRASSTCAVGERVCRALYQDTPYTQSVFLDELAEGMVEAGKAKYVTQEEAIKVLARYPKNPIVVSRVSGKHMEICHTWPERCVYWNLEKHGLRCIGRLDEAVYRR